MFVAIERLSVPVAVFVSMYDDRNKDGDRPTATLGLSMAINIDL